MLTARIFWIWVEMKTHRMVSRKINVEVVSGLKCGGMNLPAELPLQQQRGRPDVMRLADHEVFPRIQHLSLLLLDPHRDSARLGDKLENALEVMIVHGLTITPWLTNH